MAWDLGERFLLHRVLAHGAMGRVAVVDDLSAGRRVLLKTLGESRPATDEARLRFQEGFESRKRLAHPRIVDALDFTRLPGGELAYTLEWLPDPGVDGRMPARPSRVWPWLIQALEGVAYMHAQGHRHGDLRPAHLRLAPDGGLKLCGLDQAQRLGEPAPAGVGLPAYLAPEAMLGHPLDGRADLYALGSVFYHVLAGRLPFASVHPTDLLRAKVRDGFVPLVQLVPEADPELLSLVEWLLARSPLDRPATAVEALRAAGIFPATEPDFSLDLDDFESTFALQQIVAQSGHAPLTVALETPLGSPGGQNIETRMLDGLRTWSLAQGYPTLMVSAAAAGAAPLGVLEQFKRSLLALAALDDPTAPDTFAAGLRSVMAMREPRAARKRLAAVWAAPIATVGRTKPLVILLDDWASADEASQNLLMALTATPQLPLVLVFAGGHPTVQQTVVIPTPAADPAFLPDEERDLPEAIRRFAAALAIARRPLPPAALGRWLGMEEAAAASAVGALRSRGLLLREATGMRLTSSAVEWVCDGLDPMTVRQLHRTLAVGLEGLGDGEDAAPNLARHWWAAEEPARAWPHALVGARRLLRLSSLSEAAFLAQRVLDTTQGPAGVLERAEAHALLGDVARRRGHLDEARAYYEHARSLRQLPEATSDGYPWGHDENPRGRPQGDAAEASEALLALASRLLGIDVEFAPAERDQPAAFSCQDGQPLPPTVDPALLAWVTTQANIVRSSLPQPAIGLLV